MCLQTSPEHILLGLMAEQEQEEQDGYLGLGVDVRVSFSFDAFDANLRNPCEYIDAAE